MTQYLTKDLLNQQDRGRVHDALFNLPLPPNASEEFLQDVAIYVSYHEDYIMEELATKEGVTEEEIHDELMRVFNRLKEVALAIRETRKGFV